MAKSDIVESNLKHTLFSWSSQGNLDPIDAHKGKGVYIYDRDGKEYIDFSSQLVNVNIGHGHPRVAEAVARQMSEVSFVFPGMATKARGELGRKLAELGPGDLTKTFFTLGGADSVENAIKLARVVTGRAKIVSLYRSYHGSTYGAIAAGGDPRKFAVDSLAAPGFVHVENPYFYRCPWNSETPEECAEAAAAHMERIISYEEPGNIAAIIMEGESGSSGCIKYPPGYWKHVERIAKKHGILLIADEVMSGFGRTGKMFAMEHHGVNPDMMCVAKGLTSGYLPLGALRVREALVKPFQNRALPLGLTYSAHPVSCAAGCEVLNIMKDEGLVENAANMGRYVEACVKELQDKHPSIGDFRNTGLLGCIEFVKNRETKEPTTPWNATSDEMEPTRRMIAKIRELGMYTLVKWNYVFIAPPLCIAKEEVDKGMAIIDQVAAIADEYCH